MLFFVLFACATPDESGCSFPDAAVAPDGVVEDSCGWYALAVGEHLYANVYVAEPSSPCSVALGEGLSARDPIYSAMSDDAPKWTYDVTAEAAGVEQIVDVTCEDGTRWQARVDVE
ncbi:MAG: hypothetical protein Q8P41_22005 [Pseudomonadota bacterium]|nr:hypothetical protein [Pseudomonadota bacterium]